MNSFIRCYKLLKFSTVCQSEKTVLYAHLLGNPQLFSTSISSVDDERKKKPLPKTVITSTNIAELLKSSCGFSPEEAEALESRLLASAVMRKKQPKIIENAQNVIEFFRDAGFSDTHIRKVISRRPKLLNSSVEKTLKPKIRAYEDLGLSSSEIRDFVIRNASSTLHCNPASIVAKLSVLFESKEDVARVIKKNRFLPILCRGSLESIISKYLEHGVSKEKVARAVLKWPQLLFRNPKAIEENIQKAYKFGFKYGDGSLVAAANVISSMSESTWESKLQVLRSSGWKDDDIVMAFHITPTFFTYSVGRMNRTLNFLMENLKYEPFDLASHSRILTCSLDKRIIPRYNMIKELKAKGLLKRKQSFFTIFCASEKDFQKDFVLDVKDEHPELFKSYLKSIEQA